MTISTQVNKKVNKSQRGRRRVGISFLIISQLALRLCIYRGVSTLLYYLGEWENRPKLNKIRVLVRVMDSVRLDTFIVTSWLSVIIHFESRVKFMSNHLQWHEVSLLLTLFWHGIQRVWHAADTQKKTHNHWVIARANGSVDLVLIAFLRVFSYIFGRGSSQHPQ